MDIHDTLNEPLEVQNIIKELHLVPCPEGGYYIQTYRSGSEPMSSSALTDINGTVMAPVGRRNSVRNICTSIVYLLTKNSPIDFLHRNESDMVRYYHGGGTVQVYILSPDGKLHQHRLGMNFSAGDVLQVVTPGGFWEALELVDGDWALQGEAMAPGFDDRDLVLGTQESISHFSREIRNMLKRYIYSGENKTN
ncbi:uncharacterized protein LOC144355640 [Saccoglossus kowalevskii]